MHCEQSVIDFLLTMIGTAFLAFAATFITFLIGFAIKESIKGKRREKELDLEWQRLERQHDAMFKDDEE